MKARAPLALLIGVLAGAAPAYSQIGGLPFRDGSGPIEIAVDGGVEWQQEARVFVARGNARAQQGDATLRAEVITAHYRSGKDGETEIWRIDAEGDVRIASPDQLATGRKGTYDVDDPRIYTKSAILLGLGETAGEVLETMRDLRDRDVDILTLGQYLQPTKRHVPVAEFVYPERFREYEEQGMRLGFRYVAAGPMVRSSYRAAEFFVEKMLAS